jgi:hypothetical protein
MVAARQLPDIATAALQPARPLQELPSEEDPWERWRRLRVLCDHHPMISPGTATVFSLLALTPSLVLDLPAAVDAVSAARLSRWAAEAVKAVFVSAELLRPSDQLSPGHAALCAYFVRWPLRPLPDAS